VTPVVQKQLSGSAFGLDYAVPADFDVVFPSGSTALGTPPSSGSQISRWSSGVFLGERYTLRVVPDNNDLATWYPVNVSGQIGATNYFMFVEAYRRLFWERGLVVGGAIPQDDGRGLVIVRTAYTNNDPMQDAIISTSGFGELAYVGTATPNYTPVVVQPTAVPTRGRLVLTMCAPVASPCPPPTATAWRARSTPTAAPASKWPSAPTSSPSWSSAAPIRARSTPASEPPTPPTDAPRGACPRGRRASQRHGETYTPDRFMTRFAGCGWRPL
jgi:hypothetical protein